MSSTRIQFNAATVDILTLKFWMDSPGSRFIGPVQPKFMCQVGDNMVEGSVGSGPTPLIAMRNLCDSLARDEGAKTDNGKLLLR